jgi:hypothetical protein
MHRVSEHREEDEEDGVEDKAAANDAELVVMTEAAIRQRRPESGTSKSASGEVQIKNSLTPSKASPLLYNNTWTLEDEDRVT